MLLFSSSAIKKISLKVFIAFAVLSLATPVWAAGPPGENPLYNPLAMLLISLMIILLIAIGILAIILVGAGDITLLKWKKKNEAVKKTILTQTVLIAFMLLSTAVSAQGKTGTAVQTAATIGGLSSFVFYTMISIIFLELLVVLVLLMNIRLLIKKEKEPVVTAEQTDTGTARSKITWWNRFNKLNPIEEGAPG